MKIAKIFAPSLKWKTVNRAKEKPHENRIFYLKSLDGFNKSSNTFVPFTAHLNTKITLMYKNIWDIIFYECVFR